MIAFPRQDNHGKNRNDDNENKWNKNDQGQWEQYDTYETDYPRMPVGQGEKSVIILLGLKLTLDDLVDACSEAFYDTEGIRKGVCARTVQMDIQIMRSDKLGYNARL